MLHPTGVFKERLSQSALFARMGTVKDDEARGVLDWLREKGMKFHFGHDEAEDLTEAEVLGQFKMYIAAVRIHGCLRLHRNVAPKFFALVRVGTPVNIADTQPEDATLGAAIPHPTDYNDPDPPPEYMASDAVFDPSPDSGELVPY